MAKVMSFMHCLSLYKVFQGFNYSSKLNCDSLKMGVAHKYPSHKTNIDHAR